jgi:nicotinamidase-related amidase
MRTVRVLANYYQHFDADLSLEVPTENFGGWKKDWIEISLDRTAVVVMHAWQFGPPDRYPGLYRCIEWIPRAQEICRTVFPRLLAAVRASPLPLFHVVSGNYYKGLPGYQRAVALAGPEPPPLPRIDKDPVWEQLQRFREHNVCPGSHNIVDCGEGHRTVTFPPEATPLEDEGVAENGHQLFALCREKGVNHLVYAGFALNWCLLFAGGGMADMSSRGFICSAFRQATTAVENKETARRQLNKESELWRVSVAFGFVFDVDDFIAALQAAS